MKAKVWTCCSVSVGAAEAVPESSLVLGHYAPLNGLEVRSYHAVLSPKTEVPAVHPVLQLPSPS